MPHPPHDNFQEPEDKEDATIFQSASDDGTKTDAAHEDVQLTKPVELNLADPHFMANAYDTYAVLRAKGPVSRVRFVTGADEAEGAPGDGAKEQSPEDFFGGETFFGTHYDEALATLLNDRFSVDPRSVMSPEELEQQPEMPEEFQLFSRSILALDPPDHTRLASWSSRASRGGVLKRCEGVFSRSRTISWTRLSATRPGVARWRPRGGWT